MSRPGSKGHPRPPAGDEAKPYEVFPGWSVVSNWDRALVEPWADRKARRAAERAQLQQPGASR